MKKTERVQAIDRAVAVLGCFSESRPQLQLREITQELGLNKSTVHGIISTLKFHGLIEQDPLTQKYRLGMYLLQLAEIVSRSLDIVSIARPYLSELCRKMEETVHLGALDGAEVVYIDKIESTQSMRISTSLGARIPAYCTGVGKAMLAHLKDKQLELLLKDMQLKPITSNTITDPQALRDDLQRIRRRGYALDKEESAIGLSCVAAPIFDNHGNAAYALSLSGPTARLTPEKREKAILLITEAAEAISVRLGYQKIDR